MTDDDATNSRREDGFDSQNRQTEKYIGFVEADAGLTVVAESAEEAEEKLENVSTGHLGPAKVRSVEKFNSEESDDGE